MRKQPAAAARFAATLFLTGALPVQAMLYQRIDDAALLESSDVVAIGTVISAGSSPSEPLDAARYELRLEQAIKGSAARTLEVRVPGAFDPLLPGALVVEAAPRFAQGETVLLFLNRLMDGRFEIGQLRLGTFRVHESGIVQPDLPGATGARRLLPFVAWLHARDTGQEQEAGYWALARPADDASDRKLAILGEALVRWFEFDEGRSVTIYASEAGQAGVPGGGYTELQHALGAWSSDPGSNIRLGYGGRSAASGGVRRADGVNLVLFNDPQGDIAGSYDCSRGGIGGITSYRTGAPRTVDGNIYRPIVEADIVIQDGAGCLLAARYGTSGAELLGHEIGHAIGLSHSCGDALALPCVPGTPADDALMRPVIHADGRGAQLGAHDRNDVSRRYPGGGGPVQPLPPTTSVPGPGTAPPSGGGGAGFNAAALGVLLLLRRQGARPDAG